MDTNTTWIIWLSATLFCGGLALLLLRLAWWWWALRKVEREIAMYERKWRQQEQEIRCLHGVLAELEATARLLEHARDIDDVAPWQ